MTLFGLIVFFFSLKLRIGLVGFCLLFDFFVFFEFCVSVDTSVLDVLAQNVEKPLAF